MDDRAILSELPVTFAALYGRSPAVAVNSPGRVNLIGEHTDHCGGLALPFACGLSLGFAASPRDDGIINITYDDTGVTESFRPNELELTEVRERSYARGVAWSLLEEGLEPQGMNALVRGDLPMGAGLSSSAALETGLCLCMESCSGFTLEARRRADVCLRAERLWVGVGCGMMDQYACSLGREGHALLIDCASGGLRHVPLRAEDFVLLICDSRTRRSLESSDYDLRRRECRDGLRELRSILPPKAPLPRFEEDLPVGLLENISRPRNARVKHFLSENSRVRRAVSLLEQGRLQDLGPVLIASHRSLSQDMRVSTPALDLLVEMAVEAGALGARMHGGGFGGCTINLVPREGLSRFIEEVSDGYVSYSGSMPTFHKVEPAHGARIL